VSPGFLLGERQNRGRRTRGVLVSCGVHAVDVALCRRELLVPEQVGDLALCRSSRVRVGADRVA